MLWETWERGKLSDKSSSMVMVQLLDEVQMMWYLKHPHVPTSTNEWMSIFSPVECF